MKTKLTEAQITTMLEMQQGMNERVNAGWVTAGYNWYRAINVECIEAIDYFGWKWWQKTECNMPQLRMELVDIWHFILSAVLQRKNGSLALAKQDMMAEFNLAMKSVQFDNQYYTLAQMSLLEKLDLQSGLAAAKRTNLALFESILLDCEMDWISLFKQYIGKNVLNYFRQDHGYKTGTYTKVWHGREDNDHLMEVMDSVDANSGDVRIEVYVALKARYTEALQSQ
jgi:dimeric dUTPase (all-alpha-NTP-PPase superfamily)